MAKRIVDSVVFAFLKSLNAIRLYPRDVPWTIKASGFIALAREKETEREREGGRERGREAERERERERENSCVSIIFFPYRLRVFSVLLCPRKPHLQSNIFLCPSVRDTS